VGVEGGGGKMGPKSIEEKNYKRPFVVHRFATRPQVSNFNESRGVNYHAYYFWSCFFFWQKFILLAERSWQDLATVGLVGKV
jgi:hypothetical protein